MSEPAGNTPLVRMTGISKRFGRVPVLFGVDFEIRAGEVHALAGENGAGKSTLIKILAGVHTDHEGTIELSGRRVRLSSPLDAADRGISVIHQELSLVPTMSVADNIFLGRWPTRAGLVRDGTQHAAARRLLQQFGIDVDVRRLAGDLPIAMQQLIEIAKALGQDARVIVMDEPTSALNAPEVERLFGLIDDLRARGCGIVYITHKMEEIERIADRITVLRDGALIGSAPAAELPPAKLIHWMVGRDIDAQFPRHAPRLGTERLRIADFTVPGSERAARPAVEDVSLAVHAGEILGIAGLQGSGNSELLLGLFGARGRRVRGQVWLDGRPVRLRNPRQAIERGVALLTSDRKTTGLVLSLSVVANATLADLRRLSLCGWRRPGRERRATRTLADALQLRAASLDMEVSELSGGNQQKVALAKWLQTEPRLLLLDEPTRGVDVGAKREIYELMNEWTARGIAIMLITSEMPELLALSDRIVVLHRGRVTAELTREQATADLVLAAAMGKVQEGAAT
ncbi:MAG: sugar ABC transporter ATP-binding protein [Phycisphaerae bacterium]|jgi:ABC-type sugar transport system ATPase subunit